MSTKQSQMVTGKYFCAETVDFPSQKQKIHSWKVSERLRVPSWSVINARAEGLSLNATCRVFGIAKNNLLFWERKFSNLYRALFIYSMTHVYIQMVIEGDEFYTKVQKNVPPEESSGWTIVLMDRASRFIWEMSCGKKDRSLFKKAIKTMAKLVDQTEDVTLLTDGERRYGNILFKLRI